MSGNDYNLGNYHDKLDEVFSPLYMTRGEREVAIHVFSEYTRQNNLSLEEAMDVLDDPERVGLFKMIGSKSEEIFPTEADDSSSNTPLSLLEDIKFIKDATSVVSNVMDEIVVAGAETKEILAVVAKTVDSSSRNASTNNRLIKELKSTANKLGMNIEIAMATARELTERVQEQLERTEKMEKNLEEAKTNVGVAAKDIQEVKQHTQPNVTHKENMKMLALSVVFSTVAGTLFGATAGTEVARYFDKNRGYNEKPRTEIIEREVLPQSFILRDKETGKAYTIEFEDVVEQNDQPAKPLQKQGGEIPFYLNPSPN